MGINFELTLNAPKGENSYREIFQQAQVGKLHNRLRLFIAMGNFLPEVRSRSVGLLGLATHINITGPNPEPFLFSKKGFRIDFRTSGITYSLRNEH